MPESTAQTNVLESLPGIVLPIAEVNRQLGRMWQPGREGSGAPSEFRASQMNLILHFGKKTTPEDARARFDEAIHFSQRYPSRIIVLCPEDEKPESEEVLEGKLFAQCYIGHAPRTMCCCEALMLGYPPNEKDYLENQVSIWLENDLPTCHWFHRVPADRIREHYKAFSRGMKRILFDSTVEGENFREIPWDDASRVKDLAEARILPLRQSIGQYLSGFPPEKLIEGVASLRFSSSPDLSGEAANLSGWMKGCLAEAGISGELPEEFATEENVSETIRGEWLDAAGDAILLLEIDLEQSHGHLRANFGADDDWPFEAHLLGPRETLSEAVFF